jgi:hypothetical protein
MKEPVIVESDCGYWFMSDGPWMVDLGTKSGQKRLIKALREHATGCGSTMIRITFPRSAVAVKTTSEGGEK